VDALTQLDPALLDAVRTRLAHTGQEPDPASIGAAVRAVGLVLDGPSLARLVRGLRDELDGLGVLQPLVGDPEVTDVLVNGPDEVWVDRGAGLERAPVWFAGEAEVRQLAVRLAARAARRLDEATPYVDARLPGGQRLHAVLPPLSVRGTSISLRIPSRRRFTLADLEAAGTVDAPGAQVLQAVVASRAAFLISGGTGSGKTSVLGAMLGEVPGDQRMVIVEDTCELDPGHPHVVSLESRAPNVEGAGEIPMRTLVRQALRMRPDRLVVGEVRGAEVVDLLAAMNTGHEGGCGTVHANNAGSVPDRLAALAQAAGMPLSGVHAQVAAGLDVVLHLARQPGGRRVLTEVGVMVDREARAVVVPALVRQGGRLLPGAGHSALRERLGGVP
jgi:pilus assembly protein CpaF